MNEHLTSTPPELFVSLARISTDLSQSIVELANLRVDERREKAKAWGDAGTTTQSTSARDRWAQIESLPYTAEILPLQAQIESLFIERDLIILILSALHGINANYPGHSATIS